MKKPKKKTIKKKPGMPSSQTMFTAADVAFKVYLLCTGLTGSNFAIGSLIGFLRLVVLDNDGDWKKCLEISKKITDLADEHLINEG